MPLITTIADDNAVTPTNLDGSIYPSLPRPSLRMPALFRQVISRLVLIIAVYALINLATMRFVVDGASMFPQFESGQFLLVSRLHYLVNDPVRGDIAVFNAPDEVQRDYVKRVIGLPGDSVEIRDGHVYVNDALLDEPYLDGMSCSAANCRNAAWVLGPDEYLMFGDNRSASTDSRDFGPVQRGAIVGIVVWRYWPLSDFGPM